MELPHHCMHDTHRWILQVLYLLVRRAQQACLRH